MSAGLHPADSLNHLNGDSRIPLDSIRSVIAPEPQCYRQGFWPASMIGLLIPTRDDRFFCLRGRARRRRRANASSLSKVATWACSK